jgi:hypothetical protein
MVRAIILSGVMLSVVMLSDAILCVVVLIVEAPCGGPPYGHDACQPHPNQQLKYQVFLN